MNVGRSNGGASGADRFPNRVQAGVDLKQDKHIGRSATPVSTDNVPAQSRQYRAPAIRPVVESSRDARHLTLSNLDRFWKGGSPLVLPIEGSPPCQLRLDQSLGQIALITEYRPPAPDLAKFKNIDFRVVRDDEGDHAAVVVQVDDDVHGAYGLLTAIADDLQVNKTPLASAVPQAVTRHKDLIAGRSGLTVEVEIGLFGELLALEHLIRTIGDGAAVDAWQGPMSEEHDFVFDHIHCEVKTTTGERRRHLIGNLTQLVPTREIPLSVISIQITRAPSPVGRTLPALISNVRSLAGGYAARIDHHLYQLGWRADEADLYQSSWTLRNEPRAYLVGTDFPAMTSALIAPVVPNFQLVSDVTYRVDLTDLPPNSLPAPLSGFVESKER
ncbi:PD-(D/E)XK motif protein [Nocardia sp. NPDC059246]|uniref:PD-(D/E)XK motif protein n=1 Tax=unclassified Nocardia TaxID=2637762 RepID=UPI0036A10C17